MKKKEILATLAIAGTIVGTASHHSNANLSKISANTNKAKNKNNITLLASQNTQEIGQVSNTSFLHFRSGPSTNDSIISTLSGNQQMTILGEDGSWYKVNINGTIGYVYSAYVNILNNSPKTATLNNTTFLHLRSNASIYSDIIETIHTNDTIFILSQDGSWYKVEVNGQVGYVYGYYLSINSSTEPTPKAPQASSGASIGVGHLINTTFLHFRSQPSVDSNIIETLYNTSDIVVLSNENDGWYEVEVNGKTGYVDGYYLEVGGNNDQSNPASSSSSTGIGTGSLVNTTFLHFRSQPSVDSSIIDTLYTNSQITVLSNSENGWYKIEVDGQVGYVDAYYLQVASNTQSNSSNNGIGTGSLVNTTFLHFRSEPTLDSNIISTLNTSSSITVLKKIGTWYQIEVNGQVGYVYGYYLSVNNQSSITPSNNNNTESGQNQNPNSSQNQTNTNQEIGTGSLVNTTFLHFRTQPTTNSDIISTLNTNSTIVVLSKAGGWYEVEVDGQTGYVYGYYLDVTPYNSNSSNSNSSAQNSNTVTGEVVNSPYLHVRSGAGTNFSILEDIYLGNKVQVLQKLGNWYEIKINGKIGYVYDYYLNIISGNLNSSSNSQSSNQTEQGVVVDTQTLNVRSGASTTYNILGTLNGGSYVTITSTDNGWYQIQYNNQTAYVSANYIQVATPYTNDEGDATSTIESYNASGNINSYLVNIRSGASVNSSIIGQETLNSPVIITGEANNFYRVKLGKTYGFISQSYVTVNDNSNNDSNSGSQVDNNSNANQGSNISTSTINTDYPISLNDYVNLEYNNWPLFSKQQFMDAINPQLIDNMFEFLSINKYRPVSLGGLNNLLNGNGVLSGQGQAFINACQEYNIDPVYFVNQSILETGYGQSRLAKGVTISQIAIQSQPIYNSQGQLVGYQMQQLPHPVTVYNLFGIGAYDNSAAFPNRALILGTTYAYTHGWTSVSAAIAGAADFVSSSYINNNYYAQNTVYKLRFSPQISSIWHQYCTNVWYAKELADLMKQNSNLYLPGDHFTYDVPTFQS
ncbi:MAG: SH3 domain-containing protein [Sarcina sp.]